MLCPVAFGSTTRETTRNGVTGYTSGTNARVEVVISLVFPGKSRSLPAGSERTCEAGAGARILCGSEVEVRMEARTSTWAGSPEALDKWAEHVKDQVSGFVTGLPGNAGCVFLMDRESGTALTLTLWDSEEAAAATDRFADQSRASTIEATGVELLDRGAYTVVMRL
jgi:hypothetical protein